MYDWIGGSLNGVKTGITKTGSLAKTVAASTPAALGSVYNVTKTGVSTTAGYIYYVGSKIPVRDIAQGTSGALGAAYNITKSGVSSTAGYIYYVGSKIPVRDIAQGTSGALGTAYNITKSGVSSTAISSRPVLVATGALIGTAVAIPVAPLAAQAIGFGAAGIKLGSIGATMMSTMCGGATQAGSLVAVLQSVGATGTVLGSTAATTGAVAVGSTIGATVAARCGSENKK